MHRSGVIPCRWPWKLLERSGSSSLGGPEKVATVKVTSILPPLFRLLLSLYSLLSLHLFLLLRSTHSFPSPLPERFHATSSPARSTRTLGFDDLLLFLGLAKTPRIYFAISHRTNRRDDMWLVTVKWCLLFWRAWRKSYYHFNIFSSITNHIIITSLNFIIYVF